MRWATSPSSLFYRRPGKGDDASTSPPHRARPSLVDAKEKDADFIASFGHIGSHGRYSMQDVARCQRFKARQAAGPDELKVGQLIADAPTRHATAITTIRFRHFSNARDIFSSILISRAQRRCVTAALSSASQKCRHTAFRCLVPHDAAHCHHVLGDIFTASRIFDMPRIN